MINFMALKAQDLQGSNMNKRLDSHLNPFRKITASFMVHNTKNQ